MKLVPDAVPYHPLDAALKKGLPALAARDTKQLLLELMLHKSFVFKTQLNEKPNQMISALEVVSVYSDEPDHGCDQNLFEPDQYPELWNVDSPYVGKRQGLGSQGFRHLHFPAHFKWWEPITSFQIPSHPLGEAPQRAALFFRLAQEFHARQEYYWAYRFLGWSLHFIEDLMQPYHTRQIPDRHFLVLKWVGWTPGLDVPGTADQISYYHLSYERWMSKDVKSEQSALRPKLRGTSLSPQIVGPLEDYVKKNVVKFSSRYAPRIGRACYEAFPHYSVEAHPDVVQFVASPEWLASVSPDSEPLKELLKPTAEIFVRLGELARRWVTHFGEDTRN